MVIIGRLSMPVRKGQQPPWIVSDELWARIEPLLPVVPRRADHPGRKRLDDRKVLCGILFVLYTGIPWEFLPQDLGFGSGMPAGGCCGTGTAPGFGSGCTNRCWPSCTPRGALDFSRAVIDGSHIRAMKDGPKPGRARSTVPGPAPSTT